MLPRLQCSAEPEPLVGRFRFYSVRLFISEKRKRSISLPIPYRAAIAIGTLTKPVSMSWEKPATSAGARKLSSPVKLPPFEGGQSADFTERGAARQKASATVC